MQLSRTTAALGVGLLLIGLANGQLVQDLCSDINTASGAANFWTYQSNGWCSERCRANYAFAVVQRNNCWCSSYTPYLQVPISNCSDPCPGYPDERCGSLANNLFGYIALNLAPLGTLGGPSTAAPGSSAEPSTTPQPVSNSSTASSNLAASPTSVTLQSPESFIPQAVSTPSSYPIALATLPSAFVPSTTATLLLPRPYSAYSSSYFSSSSSSSSSSISTSTSTSSSPPPFNPSSSRTSILTTTLMQITLVPLPTDQPPAPPETVAIPVTIVQPTTITGPGSVLVSYDTSVVVSFSYITLTPTLASLPLVESTSPQPPPSTESRTRPSATESFSSLTTWTPSPVTITAPTTVNGVLRTVVVTSLATAPALSSDGNLQTASKGLSSGAIGGIVAGAVVGAALLLAAGFWLSRKYQKSRYGGVEDAEKKGAPRRNISVLSKTGLLAGQRRKNSPRNSDTTPPIAEVAEGATDTHATSPKSQRRTSALMYYDQRLNPTALATQHGNNSHTSVNTLRDEKDYSRPVLGVTNPDPPRPSMSESVLAP